MRPERAVILASALAASVAHGAERHPQVTLHATVDASSGAPNRIVGEFTVQGLAGSTSCFYLPYDDPDYGNDRGTGRRFEMLSNKLGQVVFRGGAAGVTEIPPFKVTAQDGSFVVRVANSPDGVAKLAFAASVPRLPDSNADDWTYDGFFPQLLASCPEEGLDALYYRTTTATALDATITLPPAWDYAGIGTTSANGQVRAVYVGRTFAFNLTRGLKTQEIKVGRTTVVVRHRTENFGAITRTIERTLPRLEALFGAFPFPSLTVVETTELQRHALPGLIAINKPAQSVFDHVQRNLLNWQHWMIVTQLARQWYGSSIVPKSPDDEWLTTGIVEFATLEALRANEQRFNLFNPGDEGYRWLSFDYLQIMEITAASLRRFSPFTALTTPEFLTRDPLNRQHAMQFVKHAFAMRQAMGLSGEQAFYGFLRNLTTTYLHGALSPESYRSYLGRMPSPFSPATRQTLQDVLSQWWTTQGWPDFEFESVESEPLPDGRYAVTVLASQRGTVDFAPVVGVRDDARREYFIRAVKTNVEGTEYWKASLVTLDPPVAAAVDPSHESFDSDRFNNSSEWAGVSFFPGSAETLRDDAYTVVWLPYALRRPGEPFSLGVQAAGFRYIQGGLFLKGEVAPKDELGAFSIRQRYQVTDLALHGDLSVDQNYDGDRLLEASVVRSPVFISEPHVGVSLKARRRQHLGDSNSGHQTIGASLGVKPAAGGRMCGYNVSAELERAPREWASDFSYERRTGSVSAECGAHNFSLGTRVFGGDLTLSGEPPAQAFFKPTDLKEARLRLDESGLDRSQKMTATNTELSLPFYLPLPSDSMILARQMRWRVFYDAGRAYQPRHDYRSAGLGITMPFGGDLSGAGQLSLTRLSLLGILFSSIDATESRKPSVIFDLTGEL